MLIRAGGPFRRRWPVVDGDFALSAADFADRLMTVETGAPRVDAQFAYFAQFLASCGFKSGFAGGGLLRDRFVHA